MYFEEMLAHLSEALEASGIQIIFTGIKEQVLEVFQRTGLLDKLGAGNFFATADTALAYVWEQLGNDHASTCSLNIVCQVD